MDPLNCMTETEASQSGLPITRGLPHLIRRSDEGRALFYSRRFENIQKSQKISSCVDIFLPIDSNFTKHFADIFFKCF